MSQPARKIAGAIASGCSIILKAAEETPAGALHIARAFHDAGLPAGVLNLVFGVPADISSYLIPQEQVRLVAFTGSTAVGKHLTEIASRSVTPVLMELGGHAPVIVCDDVDPIRAAELSVSRKARNSGQVCTSPTRFFVHKNIYRSFLDGQILVSVGIALVFSGSAVLSTSNVPEHQAGLAGGVMNTAMELGPTFGLAVFMSVAGLRVDIVEGYALAFAAGMIIYVLVACWLLFLTDEKAEH